LSRQQQSLENLNVIYFKFQLDLSSRQSLEIIVLTFEPSLLVETEGKTGWGALRG
jgi:hypothetical protein